MAKVMAKTNLTYEEVEMIKEMLSLMVVIMKRWPNKMDLMDVIYKLENPEESDDKEKERK